MEFRHLGWNAITFTLLFATVSTLIEAWALNEQRKAIWKERSGESLSVLWFSFLFCVYLAIAVYGHAVDSIAMRVDGAILALSTAPILVGLWKFKGFSGREKAGLGMFLAGIAAMAALPYKEQFFLGFLGLNVFVGMRMPWEIWTNKSRGVMDRNFLFGVLFTTSCWAAYAFAFQDLAMMLVYPPIPVVVLVTIWLWYRYPAPPQTQNAAP